MTSPLRAARAAVVFLTRVPVGGFPYSADEWRWAPACFPLVGALLGVVLGGILIALAPLGSAGAALFTLGASLLLTGAFHEDGLADTADALGGAFDRAKVLLILKDSRIGVFGACALIVSIGGRAALLSRMGSAAAWALPVIGAVSRTGPLWQMVALPYVTADGAKSRDVTRAGPAQALLGTLWSLLVVFGLVFARHLSLQRAGSLLACAVVVTAITGYRYARRVGGITGDFLGATEQLCELGCLAVLAWEL